MATRTIDLLLNLEAKPKGADALIKRFKELEGHARDTQKLIDKALNPKDTARLKQSLANIEREMKDINAEAQKRTLLKNLKAATDQANRLRERMEKLTQVGNRLALAGGAILSPFLLAAKKYIDISKDAEKERVEAIKDANEEIRDIEEERVDVVRETAAKIKDIDENLAESRKRSIDIVIDAQQELADVQKDLSRSISDFEVDAEDAAIDYRRTIEDIKASDADGAEKRRDIARATEDYNRSIEKIEKEKARARADAIAKELEIKKKQAEELAKERAVQAKLEAEKAAALQKEAQQLAELRAKERKAEAEADEVVHNRVVEDLGLCHEEQAESEYDHCTHGNET